MQAIAASLVAFTLAASLLTITPGLDTALVLRTAAARGRRAAFLAASGIGLGCLIWAALVAVGLGALLAASRLAYTVLRCCGAAYLAWVGFSMLRAPRQAFVAPAPGPGGVAGGTFARGLFTNLLNPKIGIFYVSFLPQFVPRGAPEGPFILLLGAIHVVLGLAWFAVLIAATAPVGDLLRRPAVVRWLDRVTGGVFLAFGVALALEAPRR